MGAVVERETTKKITRASTRFSLGVDYERADAGRSHLATPNSQARTGTGKNNVPCSADHKQDWQPYPIDPYSAKSAPYIIDANIRRGRRAARSSRSQGSTKLLCAKIKRTNRGVSEGKADLWPRSVFFLREQTRSRERARFLGRFSGMLRALDGWMLARAPASPAQGLYRHGPLYIFPYFRMTWP